MKELWQHFKEAKLWVKILIGALLGYGLILLIGNIRSCQDERSDRRTYAKIEAVPVANPEAARAVDSMKVVLDATAITLQELKTKTHEAEQNTARAYAVLDSLSKKFMGPDSTRGQTNH